MTEFGGHLTQFGVRSDLKVGVFSNPNLVTPYILAWPSLETNAPASRMSLASIGGLPFDGLTVLSEVEGKPHLIRLCESTRAFYALYAASSPVDSAVKRPLQEFRLILRPSRFYPAGSPKAINAISGRPLWRNLHCSIRMLCAFAAG